MAQAAVAEPHPVGHLVVGAGRALHALLRHYHGRDGCCPTIFSEAECALCPSWARIARGLTPDRETRATRRFPLNGPDANTAFDMYAALSPVAVVSLALTQGP